MNIELAKKLLTPKQLREFQRSNARLNIWEGAARSGKTYGLFFRFAHFMLNEAKPGDFLFTGKTSQALKRNVLRPMQWIFGGKNFKIYPSLNEVHFLGRVIHTICANDARSVHKLQGLGISGAMGDEIALWDKAFFQMLLSRMSVSGAKFFGSTNPEGPSHWLKTEYIDKADELDLMIAHFLISDNPTLDPVFVENLKREYTGVWYKRLILGLWCMAEGVIYDMFDDDLIIDAPPGRAQYYIVGIDYGTGNPTAAVKVGVNPLLSPRYWIEDEYYYDSRASGRQKSDEEYVRDFKKWLGDFAINNIRAIYIDPSAASLRVAFQSAGVGIVKKANNDVINGIQTVSRFLSNGSLVMCKKCIHTQREFQGYAWDMQRAERTGEDKPIKQNDHIMDALRYAIHTRLGRHQVDYSKLTR